ncbi:hypothetical protein K439DRAFT_1621892 [Ramaria rubella]|nr:hypothetical protein K439DRAFT_1621892 [Ramaria rubella]
MPFMMHPRDASGALAPDAIDFPDAYFPNSPKFSMSACHCMMHTFNDKYTEQYLATAKEEAEESTNTTSRDMAGKNQLDKGKGKAVATTHVGSRCLMRSTTSTHVKTKPWSNHQGHDDNVDEHPLSAIPEEHEDDPLHVVRNLWQGKQVSIPPSHSDKEEEFSLNSSSYDVSNVPLRKWKNAPEKISDGDQEAANHHPMKKAKLTGAEIPEPPGTPCRNQRQSSMPTTPPTLLA